MEKNLYDLVAEVRDLLKEVGEFLGWILVLLLVILIVQIVGCL